MVEVMDGEDRVFSTEAVVRGARGGNPHLPIAQRIKAMHDARQEAGGGQTPTPQKLVLLRYFPNKIRKLGA